MDIQEIKDRLADKFTAAELADLLDIPVEDIIAEYWDKIIDHPELAEFFIEDEDAVH